MSRRRKKQHPGTLRSTIALALIAFVAGLNLGSPVAAADDPCALAERLIPGTTVQRETLVEGSDRYQLILDEPGILGLHVSAPIAADSRPRLAALANCAPASIGEARWARVHETPRGLVLRIRRPSAVYIKVAPEDPDVALRAYTLRSSFAPEVAVPGEGVQVAAESPVAWSSDSVPLALPEKDVDPWEDDEVSGLAGGPGDRPCGMEKDIDPWEDDEISGLVAGPGWLYALCAADVDHDRPLCGMPMAVGDVVTGAIDAAADDDYFSFELDRQATLAVEIGGGDGARAVLYNDSGQRLETWAGSLARTLGPGRFYIRVAGAHGWVGHYAVGMDLIP